MFNIKLEEKSHKMSFKALPVKIQRSKNRQGKHSVPPPLPSPDRVKVLFFYLANFIVGVSLHI